MTLASIAIALPCWVVCQGGLTATVAVKVPVMVGVWALIGITLARRAVRSSALTDELIRAAATDPLTGLASRGELVRLLGLVEEGDAVVLLDLDEFKALNDVRGHQAGDDALAALGTIVREVLRSGDVAIRYGGDEILLVLTRAARQARTPRSRGYVHVGLVWITPRSPQVWPSVTTAPLPRRSGEPTRRSMKRSSEDEIDGPTPNRWEQRGISRWFSRTDPGSYGACREWGAQGARSSSPRLPLTRICHSSVE